MCGPRPTRGREGTEGDSPHTEKEIGEWYGLSRIAVAQCISRFREAVDAWWQENSYRFTDDEKAA